MTQLLCSVPMPCYTAFLAVAARHGHYREIDWLIDAPDARAAAQQIIESDEIESDDGYPLILIIEEQAVVPFNRDPNGRAIGTDEGVRRLVQDEQGPPRFHVLTTSGPAGPIEIRWPLSRRSEPDR